jgi:hypothetical protein
MRSPACLLASAVAVLAALLLAAPPVRAQVPPPPPARTLPPAVRAALDPLTGTWQGPFVVLAADGAPLDSLTATHRYRWDGAVQRGTLVDRYADGRVTRATARNYVAADGTLVCEVTTEGGATTVHTGRVLPDGAIVWHRTTDAGLVESYRERVVATPTGPAYHIDGFGVYPSGGDAPPTRVLFYGRYRER